MDSWRSGGQSAPPTRPTRRKVRAWERTTIYCHVNRRFYKRFPYTTQRNRRPACTVNSLAGCIKTRQYVEEGAVLLLVPQHFVNDLPAFANPPPTGEAFCPRQRGICRRTIHSKSVVCFLTSRLDAAATSGRRTMQRRGHFATCTTLLPGGLPILISLWVGPPPGSAVPSPWGARQLRRTAVRHTPCRAPRPRLVHRGCATARHRARITATRRRPTPAPTRERAWTPEHTEHTEHTERAERAERA